MASTTQHGARNGDKNLEKRKPGRPKRKQESQPTTSKMPRLTEDIRIVRSDDNSLDTLSSTRALSSTIAISTLEQRKQSDLSLVRPTSILQNTQREHTLNLSDKLRLINNEPKFSGDPTENFENWINL